MNVALIDFGSNTMRLIIYHVDDEGPRHFRQVVNKKTMASLTGYLDRKGNLSADGIIKAIDIIKSYQRKIENFGEMETYIFATAILRKARNSKKVIKRIKEETGLEVDLLSGTQEAHYGFVGAMNSIRVDDGVQFDIGGGSTEIVLIEGGKAVHAESLNFGSLSLYLDWVHTLMPTAREQERIAAYVQHEISQIPEFSGKEFPVIVGVGGTIRASGKLKDDLIAHAYDPGYHSVTTQELDELLHMVAYDAHDAMRKLLNVVPDRIHTAIPGMIVVRTIAEHFGADLIEISKYGVREGYLLDRVLGVHSGL